MTDDELRVLQEAEQAESDPSFWLHDAHLRMREGVKGLIGEMSRIGPENNGQLPSITHDLLWVLDDLTKLTKAGFTMRPPGPPSGPSKSASEEDPMEARVAKLEVIAEFIQRDIKEMKDDVREIKTNARTDFRLLFGALIAVALGLAGLMAKGFHWI